MKYFSRIALIVLVLFVIVLTQSAQSDTTGNRLDVPVIIKGSVLTTGTVATDPAFVTVPVGTVIDVDLDRGDVATNPLYVENTGTTSVTLPDPVVIQNKIGRVESSDWKPCHNVSSSTPVLISSLASITPPCAIEVVANVEDIWIGPATTTVASVKVVKIPEGTARTYNISTSTWDAALVADSTTASAGVVFHTLAQ